MDEPIRMYDDAEETASQDPNLIRTYDETSKPAPSVETAQASAEKYNYSLGKNSPGKNEIFTELLSGNEDSLRISQANVIAAQERAQRSRDFQRYMATLAPEDITAEDAGIAQSLIMDFNIPPEFVMEKEFGKRAMNDVKDAGGEELQKDLDQENPVVAATADVMGQTYLEKRAKGESRYKEWQDKYDGLSWADYGVNLAESMIPFLSQYRLTNAVSDGANDGSYFLGDNLSEQASDLWSSSTAEEFDAKLQATMQILWDKNPLDAMTFINYVMGQTSGTTNLLNLMSVIDTTSVIDPAIKGAAVKGAALLTGAAATGMGVRRLLRGSAQMANAASSGAFSPIKMADAAAQADAAHALAVKQFKDQVEHSGLRPQSFDQFSDKIDALMNPEATVGGSYSFLSRENARRLLIEAKNSASDLIRGLFLDPVAIDRLSTDEAYRAAFRAAAEQLDVQLPHLANRVVMLRHATQAEDTIHNVHVMEALLGDDTALAFPTESLATKEMKNLGLKGATVVPEGGGFMISVKKALPETNNAVRDLYSMGSENQAPVSPINTWMRYLKGHETLIDQQLAKDIKTAQFGTSSLLKLMQNEAKHLTALRKGSREKLSAFLQEERVAPDGTGTVGKTSTTLGDFETKWHSRFGDMPTDKETSAYFSFQRVNNADIILRNISILRDKLRSGLENFSFSYKVIPEDLSGTSGTPRATLKYTANEIEGKTVDHIPWENRDIEDAGIYVMDSDATKTFTLTTPKRKITGNYFRLSNTPQAEFEKTFGGGRFRIIQLSQLGQEQLRQLPGLDDLLPKGQIHFLMVRDSTPTPLRFWQVPPRPGFHLKYPMSGSFVKQARIRVAGKTDPHSTYYGDNTLFFQGKHADAERVAQDVEIGRQIMNDPTKTDADLAAHLKGKVPGYDASRFRRLFTKAGGYDPHQPFYAVRSGETTYDAHRLIDKNPKLRKATDSIYNLYRGFDLEYTMKRDMPLNTVKNVGTTDNPTYKLLPAEMMNPVHTIESAIASGVRDVYLDDLKIKAGEKFITRFQKLLDPKVSLEDLRRDPIRHMLNPPFRNVNELDRHELAAAKNYSMAAREFLAVKNDMDKNLEALTYKLAQKITKEPTNMDRWLASTIRNPASFFRGAAFHLKLGLFSPVQFFKQLNTLFHISGITNPVAAGNGLHSGLYQMFLLSNPDPVRIAHAAKRAVRFGAYKSEEHFKEAFDALRRSGFGIVGREHSYYDNYAGASILQGKYGRFLQMGTAPFRVGDQIPRLAAFNVAYKEWRTANPLAKMTDRVVQDITQRADLMTARMSAASNAQMQKGFSGIFTQFMGWQLRIAEDFLGKRLTTKEKSKLFLTYSTLYGVPVAAAGVTAVWPISETLREWELDNPDLVTANPNVFVKFAREGLVSNIAEAITGERYDFTGYGPAGLTWLEDLIDGDKDGMELLSGVSGSILHDTWMAAEPFTMMLMDTLTGHPAYSLSPSDFVGLLKISSTGSQLDTLYHGLFYGERVSRTGQKIDDVTTNEALAKFFGGIDPERIVDMYLKADNSKDRAAFQKRMVDQYKKYMRQGFEYHNNGEYEKGHDAFAKASAFLDIGRLTWEEKSRAFQAAKAGYETMITDIGSRYAKQSPEKFDAWLKELEKRKANAPAESR